MTPTILSAALVIASAAPRLAPLAAGDPPAHERLAPDRIVELIEHELDDQDIDGVTVSAADGGAVTLEGRVRSLWEMRKAQQRANATHDVTSVASHIDIARAESDRNISEDVARRIRRYVFYGIFDHVELSVRDGRVALAGQVTAEHKAEEIGNLASRVYGVQAVSNGIETVSASSFDVELRRRIARKIYDDPMFWGAASGPDSPIHVIVDRGRVTLYGVVGTPVEKARAGIIARSAFGTLGVDNELRID